MTVAMAGGWPTSPAPSPNPHTTLINVTAPPFALFEGWEAWRIGTRIRPITLKQ